MKEELFIIHTETYIYENVWKNLNMVIVNIFSKIVQLRLEAFTNTVIEVYVVTVTVESSRCKVNLEREPFEIELERDGLSPCCTRICPSTNLGLWGVKNKHTCFCFVGAVNHGFNNKG